MSEMIEKLRAYLESPEGNASTKKYLDGIAKKDAIDRSRFLRFDKWLEDNDFDKLLNRLIQEHNDDYIKKCYHKGHMPTPNNKLNFVIGYVVNNHEPIRVSELDCDFANEIYQFRGYYFQHIHGQGTITKIYNKDDNKLLLLL